MARINDNFGGYTVQTGVPAGWSTPFGTSNVDYEIINDAGSQGGKALKITKTGSARTMIKLDAIDGDNQGCLFEIDFAAGSAPSIWIEGSGASGTESGFLVELVESTNTVGLWRASSGSFTSLDSDTGLTLTGGTKYKIRLVHTPSNFLGARVWAASDREPDTWNVSDNNETAHNSGWIGISELADAGVVTVHRISVCNDDDTGCEVDDADFPVEGWYYSLSSDDTIRCRALDGSLDFVVYCYGPQFGLQQVAWHRNKEQIYATNGVADTVDRFDRFGKNREVLATGVNDCFGITFDYANSLMYYTTRQGISGDLFKNSDDGGSESLIVANAINWPGHPYFNPHDGRIYVPYDNAIRAYLDDGTLDETYPTISQPHCVVVDDTNLMVGSWNNAGLWYIPVGGGSWTNADSTYRVWHLDLTPDESTIYGAGFNDDLIVSWDSLPPPASGNRTVESTAHNTIHSVTYFTVQTDIEANAHAEGSSEASLNPTLEVPSVNATAAAEGEGEAAANALLEVPVVSADGHALGSSDASGNLSIEVPAVNLTAAAAGESAASAVLVLEAGPPLLIDGAHAEGSAEAVASDVEPPTSNPVLFVTIDAVVSNPFTPDVVVTNPFTPDVKPAT